MIAPLRGRHRWMVSTLAVAVPAVLIAALSARPEPVVGALPDGLTVEASGAELATASLEPITEDGPEGRVAIHPEHLVIELTAPLRAPSVLAYWLPTAARQLGDGSHALGPVSHGRSNTYVLPESARSGGHLLLWSLGHAEAVAEAVLPSTETPTDAATPIDDTTTPEADAEPTEPAVATDEGATS
ncbi:MAG: hypothetical protein AAGE94_09065 [Acidobacteriota bacterium]